MLNCLVLSMSSHEISMCLTDKSFYIVSDMSFFFASFLNMNMFSLELMVNKEVSGLHVTNLSSDGKQEAFSTTG